jgi:hypothetical protein
MPSAVCALTALTSLELGMRLHDHTRYGALAPEKVAPLGGGVPAALGTDADAAALAAARVEHAPLMCLGLRRLIVRGSRGQLHLPEGLERFTALEELDLGGRQTVTNLGPWLLHMPALRRVTVPERSAAQDVLETLELRNGPRQVEVVEDPDKPTFSDIDSDGFSWCDVSDADTDAEPEDYYSEDYSDDDFGLFGKYGAFGAEARAAAARDTGGFYDAYYYVPETAEERFARELAKEEAELAKEGRQVG